MNTKTGKSQTMDMVIAIMVLGSLWGLSEVVLSSALRAAGLPFRAGILTGIGVGLLAVAVGLFRRPALLVLIPPITMLCKQLVVPILHVSVLCQANSCLAVLLEGLAVAGAAYLVGRRLQSRLVQTASGASAALAAAGAFYVLGMRVAPCNYLLSFNSPAGFVSFMLVEGLVWAAFSAVFFPLGYAAGARLREAVLVPTSKPWLYYATSAALVAGSWAASALTIAAGF